MPVTKSLCSLLSISQWYLFTPHKGRVVYNSQFFLRLTPLLLGKESSEESSKPKVIGGHRHRGGKLKMMVEEEDY
jgi:hypothetical protein